MMPLYYTYEELLSSTYILFGTLHISVLGDFCILDIFYALVCLRWDVYKSMIRFTFFILLLVDLIVFDRYRTFYPHSL